MTSQFDDRLIIGYSETMTGLKKLQFHNPNISNISMVTRDVSVIQVKSMVSD